MKAILTIASGLILLTMGCTRPDETVFAVVDGRPLTAADVKDYVLVRARKIELAGHPIPSQEFVAWANSEAMGMVASMITVRMMDDEMRKCRVVAQKEDLDEALADLNRQTGKQAKSIEELAALFGDERETLMRQYDFTARLIAYSRTNWKVEPSDDLVSQYILIKTNEWTQAQKIDAAGKKNADAAYERLQKGEKWEDVAAVCSEDILISPGNAAMAKEWCWMTEDALGIKPLARVLPEMKVGEWTKPLDTREGMLIVRLLKKDRQLYQVSRMMFRMAEPVVVPPSREAAKAQLSANMLNSRKAMTLKRLNDTVKVEYPLGTNFVYKIWKETK